MNKTRIDTADRSCSPLTGCLGPRADGNRCWYCWAMRLANGRLRHHYLANDRVLAGDPHDPFAPRYWPGRLDELRSLHQPSKIALCYMSDLFGPWVPQRIVKEILDVVRDNPRHVCQLLTRWPDRLFQFSPFPPNTWVGVTATNRQESLEAAAYLSGVHAPVRYLSAEPLLGPIFADVLPNFDWVIVGAQTGPGARPPHASWVEEIIGYCSHYSIPLFLKRNLKWPDQRQEWPR